MYVIERVSEKDKEKYERIARSNWDEKYSRWAIDRQKDIYIVCTGKRGVETPVIFYMWFKQMKVEFWIWEAEYKYSIIDVRIPPELNNNRLEIEKAIRCAYFETNGLPCPWDLPSSIDDCTFKFETI